jgi:hypothetical protein
LAVDKRTVVVPVNPFLLSEVSTQLRLVRLVQELVGDGLTSAGAKVVLAIVADFLTELERWVKESAEE